MRLWCPRSVKTFQFLKHTTQTRFTIHGLHALLGLWFEEAYPSQPTILEPVIRGNLAVWSLRPKCSFGACDLGKTYQFEAHLLKLIWGEKGGFATSLQHVGHLCGEKRELKAFIMERLRLGFQFFAAAIYRRILNHKRGWSCLLSSACWPSVWS